MFSRVSPWAMPRDSGGEGCAAASFAGSPPVIAKAATAPVPFMKSLRLRFIGESPLATFFSARGGLNGGIIKQFLHYLLEILGRTDSSSVVLTGSCLRRPGASRLAACSYLTKVKPCGTRCGTT